MKWISVKDQTPKTHFIYITDYVSTWTAHTPFSNWKSFTLDNPEYAWAKIPIPKTPKNPKDPLCGYSIENKNERSN